MECDKCLEMFDEHKTLGIVLKGEDYVISVCEKCLAKMANEGDDDETV